MFKKILLLFLVFLVFFLPVSFFLWWNKATSAVSPNNKETQLVVIPQGWGVEKIAKRLKAKNLIKNVFAFKIMVTKEGISTKLQAGDFTLSPSMNLWEIVQSLTHGTLDIWVTIPEGLRREEVAKIIANAFKTKEASFNINSFIEKSSNLEGFLFPDTYLVPKSATVDGIIKILHNSFLQKTAKLDLKSGLTKKQTVILASLVEREAKHDKDRPIIAGILLKRLKEGWPLEVDATLQYIKANKKCQSNNLDCKWWPKALPADKKIKSPFNTYQNLGLPPAAICNPGLSSLKAAAAPQFSSFWFYLSDSSGNIHYAKTLSEQQKNINKYLN